MPWTEPVELDYWDCLDCARWVLFDCFIFFLLWLFIVLAFSLGLMNLISGVPEVVLNPAFLFTRFCWNHRLTDVGVLALR